MPEMINYIFNKLGQSDKAVLAIRDRFKKQTKFNKAMVFTNLALTIYIMLEESHNKEQDQKIKDLQKEIKELKKAKGE